MFCKEIRKSGEGAYIQGGGKACNRNASLLDGIPFAYAVDEPVSGGGVTTGILR